MLPIGMKPKMAEYAQGFLAIGNGIWIKQVLLSPVLATKTFIANQGNQQN